MTGLLGGETGSGQRITFGGMLSVGDSLTTPPKLNLVRLEEDLSQAHLRLAHATIERLPWADCVRRYDRPHTLFYMDPPYWGLEGYGVEFPIEEYSRMAEAARTMKGRAIISVNDCPEMRAAFKGLPTRRFTISAGRVCGSYLVRTSFPAPRAGAGAITHRHQRSSEVRSRMYEAGCQLRTSRR